MTARPTVLIVSNIAWDFVWQRHQTIATLWAREHEVVFLELPGIRRVGWRDGTRILRRAAQLSRRRVPGAAMPPQLRVLRPWVLPATNRFFCALNRQGLRRLLAREPILRAGVDVFWTYSASRTALDLIDAIPHQRLVYDCTDDWSAVEGIPSLLEQDEGTLLQRANLTLVPSRVLAERKRPFARRLERVPHGAWVHRFSLPAQPARERGEIVTALYYGHLHRQHLDFEALAALAEARPRWRIVLVGPVKTPHRFPSNVALPGGCAHEQLRGFIEQADVLLLPYRINRYTEAVMPAKTYECLATGKPVVATPLPELVSEVGSMLRCVPQGEDWARAVEQALESDNEEARRQRVAAAQANTWEVRFARIMELLARNER